MYDPFWDVYWPYITEGRGFDFLPPSRKQIRLMKKYVMQVKDPVTRKYGLVAIEMFKSGDYDGNDLMTDFVYRLDKGYC